jgi:hypothetical protein
MDYTIGYLLALLVIALGFLGIILGMIILEVNKRKFVVSFILSLVLVVMGGYYYWTVALAQHGVSSPNRLHTLLKPSAESIGILPPAPVVPAEEPVYE